MQPRRATFAADYIGEAVGLYEAARNTGVLDEKEEGWARDVLSTYFDTVEDTPAISAAKNRFDRFGYRVSKRRSVPYPAERIKKSGVRYDDLLSLFMERRSVRWFLPVEVPFEPLCQAVDAATWAPSACNRQPFKFVSFRQPKRAAEIAAMAGGTGGFAHNIPCLVVVVGDLSCYEEERDRHLVYIDGALASMQLMLALQTLGLSSCPINWPDIEEREVDLQSELGLAYYERPIMFIGVGYADPSGQIPFSSKKGRNVLLTESA